MKNKIFAWLSVGLIVLQVVMILGSWLYAALNP